MKKIIFVEPYVSMGGHNYKHLTVIPATFERIGVDYKFISEQIVNPPFQNDKVDFCLSYAGEYKGLQPADYIQKRGDEFKRIISENVGGLFVFLTTLEEDFKVWMSLFSDIDFQTKIKVDDAVIIIQSTAGLYKNMLFLSEQEKQALMNLKAHVFWGQYTDLQVIIGKELVPEMNFFECLLPIYDFFMRDDCKKYDDRYLSYIGRFDEGKGPWYIIPALKSLPDEEFFIHFYPVTDKNFLFYCGVVQSKGENVKLYNDLLTRDQYADALCNAKLGLLPYDSYEYSIRATGVLEEYILNGVPVIVPKDSWLEYILKEHCGGGMIFDENEQDGFIKAINEANTNYAKLKKEALLTAESFKGRMKVESFVEKIRSIESTREAPACDCERIKKEYAKTISKGYAYFFKYCAEEFLYEGDIEKANECANCALEHDKTYVGKKNVCLQVQLSELESKVDTKYLHLLGVQYKEQGDNKRFEELLKKYFENNTELVDALGFLNSLGDLSEIQDNELKEKLSMIMVQGGERIETSPESLYHIASLQKRFGKYDRAFELFNKIAVSAATDRLKSGAFFHLGEIALKQQKKLEAEKNFKKVLKLNPHHLAAREYLKCVLG